MARNSGRERTKTVPFGGASDDEQPEAPKPKKRASTAIPDGKAKSSKKRKKKEAAAAAIDPAFETSYPNPLTALEPPKTPYIEREPTPIQATPTPVNETTRSNSVWTSTEQTPTPTKTPTREPTSTPAPAERGGKEPRAKRAKYPWGPIGGPVEMAMIDSFIESKNCGMQNGPSWKDEA